MPLNFCSVSKQQCELGYSHCLTSNGCSYFDINLFVDQKKGGKRCCQELIKSYQSLQHAYTLCFTAASVKNLQREHARVPPS